MVAAWVAGRGHRDAAFRRAVHARARLRPRPRPSSIGRRRTAAGPEPRVHRRDHSRAARSVLRAGGLRAARTRFLRRARAQHVHRTGIRHVGRLGLQEHPLVRCAAHAVAPGGVQRAQPREFRAAGFDRILGVRSVADGGRDQGNRGNVAPDSAGRQGGVLTMACALRVLLLLVTALSAAWTAHAQGTTAIISGVVADETGGALPGVTVTITHVDTSLSRTLVTDQQGRYRAAALEPGTYDISAELSGFQTSVYRTLNLAIGQDLVANVTLRIGQIQEQVVVSKRSQLVEITRSAVTGFVDQQQMRDLPLNRRDFTQLTLLAPAVTAVP